MDNHPDKSLMLKAIEEARASSALGQYALGSVVVSAEGKILATAHTSTHADNDSTAHAEVNAIRMASEKTNNLYLQGCWLYSTLEPCPMCTAAAIWAKMEGIVFGASKEDAMEFAANSMDKKFTWRQIDISSRSIIEKGEPKLKLHECFMRDECKKLFKYAAEQGVAI
jgi:tRNA(Arg) A34 adenosine deaminase TadA